ncbi:elongation factor P--(R)-beta-lysine ligase [Marinicella pacifica]|uniref:Elongation factor P--(R)-beta-lysine ligase n=1 Tax=Marinicella pacifica TaxID=1171543 RepID=A0A917CDL1_9GAMM|nr:EF-P lysine aminoacylase EpmA [Marinicella pacifica]GGF85550.1 elongation factor P--(R)-beta-lysine ligase [Marinicella pacifica]
MHSWSFQSPLERLQQRAFLLSKIRSFFAERNVLEVQTPILSSAANTDQHIEVFSTEPIVGTNKAAFLRTSPEFFHKRLLASGSGDIFEIAPVFRREECGDLHNPEFTLLEWYRLDFDLQQLMNEVDDFIQSMASHFHKKTAATESISYQELFISCAQVDPFDVSCEYLNKLCRQHGYRGNVLSRSQALDYVFALMVQPSLTEKDGVLVYHFPIEQAALAQPHPDDPACCLRFEYLFRGIELANGYRELSDAQLQRQRFEQDLLWRKQQHKPTLQFDENLLTALRHGLPDCSGVAIGIERLLMCLLGLDKLNQVMGFTAQNS